MDQQQVSRALHKAQMFEISVLDTILTIKGDPAVGDPECQAILPTSKPVYIGLNTERIFDYGFNPQISILDIDPLPLVCPRGILPSYSNPIHHRAIMPSSSREIQKVHGWTLMKKLSYIPGKRAQRTKTRKLSLISHYPAQEKKALATIETILNLKTKSGH